MFPPDCFMRAEPTPDILAYNAEVMHYIMVNTDFDEHASLEIAKEDRTGHLIRSLGPQDLLDPVKCKGVLDKLKAISSMAAKLLSSIMVLLTLCQGPFSDGEIKHYCKGDCVCGRSRAAAMALVVHHATSLLLRKLPTVPAANKWTKIGPCMDFVVAGILVFALIPRLFAKSFAAFTFKLPPAASAAEVEDPGMQEEVNKSCHYAWQ